MAFKIISCTKGNDGYRFRVHLDVSKPDSNQWVQGWTWGLPQKATMPQGSDGAFYEVCHTQHGKDMTEEQYLKNIEDGLPGLVEIELHRRLGTNPHDASHKPIGSIEGKVVGADPISWRHRVQKAMARGKSGRRW